MSLERRLLQGVLNSVAIYIVKRNLSSLTLQVILSPKTKFSKSHEILMEK